MVGLDREDRVQDPVIMRSVVELLLTGLGIDCPQRVVRAAESNQLAVVGPAGALECVVTDTPRELQRALGHVPDLHFSQAAR